MAADVDAIVGGVAVDAVRAEPLRNSMVLINFMVLTSNIEGWDGRW